MTGALSLTLTYAYIMDKVFYITRGRTVTQVAIMG